MATHDQMRQQAERLRNTFRDFLDQPNDGQARAVAGSIERLISDLNAKKNGDAIENDLKTVISQLDRMDQAVMDLHHSDALRGDCENMLRSTNNL